MLDAGRRCARDRRARRWPSRRSTRRWRRSSAWWRRPTAISPAQEPWALKKTDPARMETVLWTTAETVRRVGILCQPFMPGSAAKLLDLLAVPADERDFANVGDAMRLVAGHGAAGAGSRSSRAMSSRPRKPERDARRQPLPSRLSRTSPRSAAAVVARARAAGVGRMVTISTRVTPLRAGAGDRRGVRRGLLLGRHPSAQCRRGTRRHGRRTGAAVGASEGRGHRRGGARLSLRQVAARRAGAGLPHAHRGGARHRPAAGHPCPRAPTRTWRRSSTEETGKGAFPFVLHCFSSGRELARTGVALGGYVSFSGILTFRNSEELRAIAADVPHDRLLVETDAPYLAPVPLARQDATSRPMSSTRRRCWPRRSA